ncbi:MAG: hypothetical protein U9O98_03350 [Asgard group archaeon]|nr:hypothetical protein [Asgard group archaeon]
MSLKQIWILQESGTCIFHQKYDNTSSDENLISGFLSAVNSFINSLGASLKWLEADELRLVFKISEEIIYVACTSTDCRPNITYKRLERIAQHFEMMLGKDYLSSGCPIPIDSFKKIAPTINRIFGLPDTAGNIHKEIFTHRNVPDYKFDSPEARLMSFIRYKREVSVNEIMKYLRLSDDKVNETLAELEDNKIIRRFERPDGSELYSLSTFFRGGVTKEMKR